MDLSLVYVYPFDEWVGRPSDELKAEIKRHYPYSQIHYGGGGRIDFFTGLWLGHQQIVIRTPLYESVAGDGTLSKWK